MIQNLRPREAALALGCSESQFWVLVKTDPDFPTPIRLGKRCTVIRANDLAEYLEKKVEVAKSAASAKAT